ncbi:Antiadhesin Pls binding protein [Patulibacter medicamentivorans]|uniref:Antiadhesin Pls binding protein n=1 Tax=Patulibacter medicamentivorans TaxID=1097667 RepID=H0E1C2_9ACTN|nr:Antiadhesin Pls binding protein [Patulibacter medicamentivorans]
MGCPAAQAVPPPLQSLDVERRIQLRLPPEADAGGKGDTGGAHLAPDAKHLYFSVTVGGKAQIAVTDLDGRGYRCITCGRVPTAQKADLLEDGRRMWLADNSGQATTGNPLSGGTGDFQWSILECAPSVYRCERSRVVPVRFPLDSLLQGAQNREATVDAYGEFVAWNEVRMHDGPRVTLGRLERRADEYVVTDPRVVTPQFRPSNAIADWINGGRFYEGASFVDGNRYLKYQATTTGLNYDTYLLDLRTGQRRQMTTDLDYNEVARYSPDGRWMYYTSARGLDRMDVFTQLERPSLIDASAFGQLGRVSLWNNRRCMNEGWLMDRASGQQRGGYGGQPTLLEDDWNLRSWEWLPGGDRAVVTETRLPNRPDPSDPAARTRISVVRMPGVAPAPAPPTPIHVDRTAYRRWTTPASEYTGMAGRQVLARTVPGPAGGTATMTFLGTYLAGSWSVRYDGYSDDGRTFLDGWERVDVPSPILLGHWSADIRARGARPGFLRGDVTVTAQERFSGTVESEVAGRRLRGIPTQETCPGLRQPALRARIVGTRPIAGRRMRVRVAVDARVAEDSLNRPVQQAVVRATVPGRRRVRGRLVTQGRTDEHGRITLTIPRAAEPRISAAAGGFRPTG